MYADKDQQAINVALEIGSQGTVEALLWLHQEFDVVVRPFIIPILAKLAGRPESIKDVDAFLATSLDGHRLLREPEFAEPLKLLAGDQAAPPEARNIAEKLSALRQELYHWPRLWLTRRPADLPRVGEWLDLVGLKHNPFGPEQAELEPLLSDYGAYPAALEPTYGPLRGARPAILFGGSGSGKTAAAILLAYDCTYPPANPREKETFPVYFRLSLDISSGLARSIHLSFTAKAVGEALIHFLALNPYTFLEHGPSAKAAIAYFLTYITGSLENLIIRLKQGGLSAEGAGQRLLVEVTEIGKDLRPDIALPETILLEMLQQARPVGFTRTYVLADVTVDLIDQRQMAEIARQLQPLLALMIPLAGVGVYLKLFLPADLKSHLHIPAGVTVETIQWTPAELEAMLAARLQAAGVSSLSQLFDPHSRHPDPAKSLVEAAKRSPRRLIHLGNRLIEAHIAQRPGIELISRETLKAVLEAAASG